MKRSGRFYRKNEKEVMELLGLTPTPNSGSGWIVKEDGQNDKIICQLKSTDKMSIKINLKDIETLIKNSKISHKVPLFAIQFIQTDRIFLLVDPSNIEDIWNHLNGQEVKKEETFEKEVEVRKSPQRVIKSSQRKREQFFEDRSKLYKKIKKAK